MGDEILPFLFSSAMEGMSTRSKRREECLELWSHKIHVSGHLSPQVACFPSIVLELCQFDSFPHVGSLLVLLLPPLTPALLGTSPPPSPLLLLLVLQFLSGPPLTRVFILLALNEWKIAWKEPEAPTRDYGGRNIFIMHGFEEG